jgi:hypothetical protein
LELVISLKTAKALGVTPAYADDGNWSHCSNSDAQKVMFMAICQCVRDYLHVKDGAGATGRPTSRPNIFILNRDREGKTPRLSTLLRSDGDVECIAVDGA